MKKLFAVAFLATAFTLTSCGGGGSLVDKVADCTCQGLNDVVKLKKEADAAPEDKKAEILAKLADIKEPACMKDLEAEAKKVSEADQAKMETELKAAIDKKCGAAMKELGM